MKTLTLLCSALIIIPALSQAREEGYGGFNKENIQKFYDYIHGQDMIKVQEGDELNQAIDAIPINLGTEIDLEQERGLRNWLHQYLIAFSESGSDSLAAIFYLRAGFNEERYEAYRVEMAEFAMQSIQNSSVDIEIRKKDGSIMSQEEAKKAAENMVENARAKVKAALKEGPMSIFRSEHKHVLKANNRDYFIENVSFHDSEFRVFELDKETPTFLRLVSDRGMLPKGNTSYSTTLAKQLFALLEEGERIICADIMFIAEEPLEFTPNLTPGRTPSFFRLMWDQDNKLWRHLEVFYSPGVKELYLFGRGAN